MPTTTTGPTFGERIRERREQLGLTQRELKAAVATSHVTVGYWERDKHLPEGVHFVPLARALKLSPGTLGRWLPYSPIVQRWLEDVEGDSLSGRNPG